MKPSRKYLRNRQVECLARDGNDQVFNRMLTCWIDESPEQDTRVLARVLPVILGRRKGAGLPGRDPPLPGDVGGDRPAVHPRGDPVWLPNPVPGRRVGP